MACTPPPAWGVKILEKSLQRGRGGVRKFYFGRGGSYIVAGGGRGGGGG